MKIGLTGTPGTGKTSIAKALAKRIGAECVDVKKIIEENKPLYYVKKGEKEKTVHLEKLEKKLAEIVRAKKNVVIESHLLCEIRLPLDVMAVLRCHPRVLEKRLKRRRYPAKKVRENVLAEALDYCLVKAEENYGRVIQVDCTKERSAGQVWARIKKRENDVVDWSKALLDFRDV